MAATNNLLALSLVAVAGACCASPVEQASAQPAPDARAVVATASYRTAPLVASAPQIHKDLQQACDTGSDTTMKGLMADHINGRMTEISFLLHHDGRPPEERMMAITETAAGLLSCIQAIPDYRGEIPLDRRSEYYQLMSDLQADAFALHLASMEIDEEAVNHWFYHLKQDCNACHARFRPAY